MSRRKLISWTLVVAVVGLGAVGWWVFHPKAQADEVGAFTRTATVANGTVTTTISAQGNIEPAKSADLSFTVSGQVKTLDAVVGDVVTTGQKLATLTPDDLDEAIAAAESALAKAELQVTMAEQSLTAANLNSTAASQSVTSARLSVTAAQEAVDTAKRAASTPSTQPTTDPTANPTANPTTNPTNQPTDPAPTDTSPTNTTPTDTIPTDQPTSTPTTPSTTSTTPATTPPGPTTPTPTTAAAGGAHGSRSILAASVPGTLTSVSLTSTTLKASALMADNPGGASGSGDSTSSTTSVSQAEAQLQQARSQLTSSQAQATNSSAQVTQAESQLADAQANLTAAQKTLADTRAGLTGLTLSAPFAGVITAVSVAVGDTVTAASSASASSTSSSAASSSDPQSGGGTGATSGTVVISLSTIDALQVAGAFAEADAAALAVGQTASLTFPAVSDVSATGAVTLVSPTASSSGGVVTYSATVALDQAPTGIRLGQTTEIIVVTAQADDVLCLPSNAVTITSTSSGVVTLQADDGTTSLVEVGIGLQGDSLVEIASGLTEGQIVVVSIDTATGGTSSDTNSGFRADMMGGAVMIPGGSGGPGPMGG